MNTRKRNQIIKTALIHLQSSGVSLTSSDTGLPLETICLEPYRPYLIGRSSQSEPKCDFLVNDRRVSKFHCQILFDGINRKIYIIDGLLLFDGSDSNCIVSEFRQRLDLNKQFEGSKTRVKVSVNGLFINGIRVERGLVRELCTGDDVSLVCGNEGLCNFGGKIGFLIKTIVFKEEIVVVGENEAQLERRPCLFRTTYASMGCSQGSVSSGGRNKRVFALRENEIMASECDNTRPNCRDIVKRARFLLSRCREVLSSDDPISYIQHCSLSDFKMEGMAAFNYKMKLNRTVDKLVVDNDALGFRHETPDPTYLHVDQDVQNNRVNGKNHERGISEVHFENNFDYSSKNNAHCLVDSQMKTRESYCQPPGKKFYLNRLQFMEHGSFNNQNVVSLPELLHPIETVKQIFIATFTSDILWFLSHCEIPCHLPVTIACHNTERCWSSSPESRTSMPYANFPNLTVVFPPFPESIAFGNDRKRQGIGCHHPKLLVLQREGSIRVIITSANLVPNQWNNVTNTIWWQDFPRRSTPDLSSLFVSIPVEEITQGSKSDFAAHLAGFIASLVIDVPSQAHWIMELTKYNFDDAMGYLVASVPGIYSCKTPAYLCALESTNVTLLGSVEAFVVGLSHLFRTSADTNGVLLKKLAFYLGRSCENALGMSKIVLRRNTNVLADVNAVSVLVPSPGGFSEEGEALLTLVYLSVTEVTGLILFAFVGTMALDFVQLGFLPRNVAKWVSPLWDGGFFDFSGYIYPKEALAAASGGNNMRVQLILHLSQGPYYSNIIPMMQPEHVIAFGSLIGSIQRCTGLWRLQEVLDKYKWPEEEQSDFIYGSSSMGSSINAQFLSAFSSATGKRSLQLCDPEESDPEWSCWTASQELRNPSIRIIFPTIQRVKNAFHGILSSRRILCFSEKTWQRLRTVDILYDAVPHPCDRIGHPMHVKVARRRFQSKTDASSSGWVYCGSHNFSAAAWGRHISNPSAVKSNEMREAASKDLRLHVCNYELGIIFIFPSSGTKGTVDKDVATLDDVVLPFVTPAPKYGPTDRPATKRAMREALVEFSDQEKDKLAELANLEETNEEIPDEEEEVDEATPYVVEKEEEKAYAEMLWNQVSQSQSC